MMAICGDAVVTGTKDLGGRPDARNARHHRRDQRRRSVKMLLLTDAAGSVNHSGLCVGHGGRDGDRK